MFKSLSSSFRPLLAHALSLSLLFGWTTSFCLAAASKEDEQIVFKAMNLHDWKASRKMLDQYLVTHPKSELIVASLTRVSSNLNTPADTIKFAARYFALKPKPVDPSVYVVRAYAYQVTNQPKKAWLDIEQARKLRPEDGEMWIVRGHILDKAGRMNEALAAFDHALKLNMPRAYSARADTEFRHKLFKESRIDDLKFTAQIREFEPAGQRAFELFHTGRNTEALSLADGLIAQNCSYLQIYSVRAYALHNLGRNPEAWQACITCTNKTGEVDDPLRYWILWSMRDWNGALVYVQKMIKKNPKDHGLYFLRAECLKNLEKYGEALSDYDRFPDVMNDNPSAHDGRAECLLRLGKDNEAAKELQVINSTRPTFQSLEQEARCYRSLKRYSEAVTCFTKAIILRPLSAPNIAARAECYRRLKDYPRALKDFSDAITLSPKFFVYFYGRGLCYLDMNRNEDAVQDFTAALADPNLQSRAYADRARAYEKLGKKLLAQKDRLAANSANSASRAIEDDLFK